MKPNEFIEELKKINIYLSKSQQDQLAIYAKYLLEYNKKVNLTAIKTPEEVYLKHFFDSLTIFQIENIKTGSLLDVGTGAGFPGMVLAVVFPTLKVTLLDANNKKINFLKELNTKLNLKNIAIINQRAEEYTKIHREQFDYVVSRAVADLRILLELNIPALKIHGKFIAMKGNITEELKNAIATLNVLHSQIVIQKEIDLPKNGGHRTLIVVEKQAKTNLIYPRNYAKIKKQSLKEKNIC